VNTEHELGLKAFLEGQSLSDLGSKALSEDIKRECEDKLAAIMCGSEKQKTKTNLDSSMQGVINKVASDIIKGHFVAS
jgi:hypothetical protein